MADVAPGAGILAGRDRELATLRRWLAEALAGHGRLVVLTGPPGIGKTRLAEELADGARRAGQRVLWGRAVEERGAPPLWPWRRILDAVGGASERDRLAEDPGRARADDLTAVRFRAAAAAADALTAAAHAAGLLIVLEDLHWADHASLFLLRELAAELPASRLLVLATCRDTAGRSLAGRAGRPGPATWPAGDAARPARRGRRGRDPADGRRGRGSGRGTVRARPLGRQPAVRGHAGPGAGRTAGHRSRHRHGGAHRGRQRRDQPSGLVPVGRPGRRRSRPAGRGERAGHGVRLRAGRLGQRGGSGCAGGTGGSRGRRAGHPAAEPPGRLAVQPCPDPRRHLRQPRRGRARHAARPGRRGPRAAGPRSSRTRR